MSASASIDHRKAARRGPEPLSTDELRTFTISVRLNGAELAALDGQRAPVRMQRGEYLRCAALHRLPPTIPAVNQTAYVALARAAGNLNAISRRLHEAAHGFESTTPSPKEIADVLADFRLALIGTERAGDEI